MTSLEKIPRAAIGWTHMFKGRLHRHICSYVKMSYMYKSSLNASLGNNNNTNTDIAKLF